MLDVNNVLPTLYNDRKMKKFTSMTSTSIEKRKTKDERRKTKDERRRSKKRTEEGS